jgi:hypothetical protein
MLHRFLAAEQVALCRLTAREIVAFLMQSRAARRMHRPQHPAAHWLTVQLVRGHISSTLPQLVSGVRLDALLSDYAARALYLRMLLDKGLQHQSTVMFCVVRGVHECDDRLVLLQLL